MLRSITFDITAEEPDLVPRRCVLLNYLFTSFVYIPEELTTKVGVANSV